MPSTYIISFTLYIFYIINNHKTLIKRVIMVKFKVNGSGKETIVTLPESIKELTPEYLKGVASEITVADNYSLIALCYKEKLSAFVLAGRNKKNQINTAVVPLFVKKGKTSNSTYVDELVTGDKLLISPTAMSLGLHVNVPKNTLTMGLFIELIKDDMSIYQKALALNKDVIFVEYKLIPNSDIIGAYNGIITNNFKNPFTLVDAKYTDITEGV